MLDDAGREPRRRLPFVLHRGKRDIAFTSVTTPGPLRAELAVGWECAADGDCHYVLTSFDVYTGSHKQSFEQLATGTRGDVSSKPDGTLLIQPTTFMHTTPSLVELLKLAIVPLPRAPFGVGAEWHITDNDSRRTYTVAAITPTKLSLRFAASYDGPQPSKSSGTLEVNTDDLLARSFEITQVTHLSAGSAQIEMTSNVTLKSLP